MLPRLHILVDNFNLAEKAIKGGAKLIQYRNKSFSKQKHLEELNQIKKLCENNNTLLIINDFVELAIQINADGIHVGIEDTPLNIIEKTLPPNKIVGFTVHNLQELDWAHQYEHLINYIGVGALFPSPTKKVKLLNPEIFKQICKLSKFPVIAIGGITQEKICEILQNGAYGIAVSSAFSKSKNPSQVVTNMLNTIHKCIPSTNT